MPSVKVCLWNIQNYGGGDGTAKWGADSHIRNLFIRDFVRDQQIDVLLIMEVSPYAQTSISDLMTTLNGGIAAPHRDWCYSFCGSGLAHHGNVPPQDEDDLTFASDARHEGYGVLWRSNQAARFAVLPALQLIDQQTQYEGGNGRAPGRTPLNLIITGRPADTVPAERNNYRPLGGYTVANTFPYRNGVLMNHWPNLDMATTSVGNPHTLSFANARRPVYIVLDLNNGGTQAQRLCPVGAYHAPSNQKQASWGAGMSSLSRELYVTNQVAGGVPNPAAFVHTNKVVLGGDYNYSVNQPSWPSTYEYYTRAYNAAYTGGANCVETPAHGAADTARRTTVQLLEGDHVTPIVGANVNDYLSYKIDLAFMRPNGTVTGDRVDMLTEFINDAGGAIYGPTLKALRVHLSALVAAEPADADHRFLRYTDGPQRKVLTRVGRSRRYVSTWKPVIHGSWGGPITNWNAFMTRLYAGQVLTARRAAELYHIFVSDHLPLVVDIPI
ncbi:MAG TPA: hypothetical protein VF736_21845 [Pyrinomonadaceae bacterium]|jgi:hypothetical protein